MSISWRAVLLGFLWACAASGTLRAAPKIPEVDIADGPIFIRGNVHPNMLLSVSGDASISGIAYPGEADSYDRTMEYIGYFNPLKCYRYRGGNRNVVDGYFAIAGNADALHECRGMFSGNFMNWAASSTLDLLRYAWTGGDRIVDAPEMTILQRAVLKRDSYADKNYFPRRIVTGGGNTSMPDRVTPFRAASLMVVSCGNRILFSDSANIGNNCETPAFDSQGRLLKTDKRLGEYLARVQVCDQNEGTSRTDLCQRFGGNFKPVGELQRHADKIRFAAMGYLQDDSKNRYGGVLKAPMKYIGIRKFAEPGFVASTNDHSEWNPATGVFYSNPDDTDNRLNAGINSGVINYINKLGRSGIYRTVDPVSELYYEGLRYLQGKPATPDAMRGVSEAMKDGFPVLNQWKDPVTASCQRNYIVAVADANTQWDRYVPGNDRTMFNQMEPAHDLRRPPEAAVNDRTPALDVKAWTGKVADMESDATGQYANPSPRAHLQNLENTDTGFEGRGTYYISGLAYWANTNDIRLDKPVRVKTFIIDVDDGGDGLIDGNRRAIKPRDSQLYLAAKYGGFDDANEDANPFITFAADGKSTVKRGNAEWDRSGNGIPSNYFLAHQPRELIRSLRGMFSRVTAATGVSPGAAVTSGKISPEGMSAYLAGFTTARWSGSLKKFSITRNPDGKVNTAKVPEWDAAEILTGTDRSAPVPGFGERKIYTSVYNSQQVFATVPFRWSEAAESLRTFLNISPVDFRHDGHGESRLNFLRGDRGLEMDRPGGFLRVRDSVLGDIVNSVPVHVGAPAAAAQGNGYHRFFEKHRNRTNAVYVGANDGMLHAFDADSGMELFSYIPNALWHRLHRLASPDYAHVPYVDGEMAASDAVVSGEWRTVLASTMGGGAQGVFALDVSNPSEFGTGSGALWEFTDRDDPDIGNLFGAPVIAKFRTKIHKGNPEYQYFVVIPSGLNTYRDDGSFNETAQGALFLLSLDKTPSEKWKAGVNYFKIKLPLPDVQSQYALAAPALAVGNDGAVRYAYAGDLQGNLWRFDFTGVAPWTGALGRTPVRPLFVAKDEKGARQPITAPPRITYAPGGGYVILFGTGKFLEDADAAPDSFKTQSFYGILDPIGSAFSIAGRAELVPRTLSPVSVGGNDAIEFAGAAFGFGIADPGWKGWYFDFPKSEQTGERSVTSPVVGHRSVVFNTLIPGKDPCSAGGGRSYLLDTLTGLPPNGKATGYLYEAGLLGSPIVLETGTLVGARNPIGRKTARKTITTLNPGTHGGRAALTEPPDGSVEVARPAGRLSWREIINWQELRDAVKKK